MYNSDKELGTVVRQNPPVFIGKKKDGVKKGSPMDARSRTMVHVGNPAPKAKKDGDKKEVDPLKYLDTINIRKADEIKNYKKRKLEKTKKDSVK